MAFLRFEVDIYCYFLYGVDCDRKNSVLPRQSQQNKKMNPGGFDLRAGIAASF